MNGLDEYPSLEDFGKQLDRLAAREAHRPPWWRRRPRMSVPLAVVLGVAAAGTATAGTLVAIQDSSRPSVAPVAPIKPPPGPGNLSAAHQESAAAMRAYLDHGQADFAGTDWTSLRLIPIPGSKLTGWSFTQGAKRCLALPDPIAEGYGITCKTPKAIRAGEATVLVLVPANAGVPNIVGALVADDATASLDTPTGPSKTFRRTGDVYAGTAPAGSRLTAAGKRLAVDSPPNPLPAPAAP